MKELMHLIWCVVLPFCKLYYKTRKGCRFAGKTYFSYLTKFEGYNYIGEGGRAIETDIGYRSYISDNSYFYNTSIGRYTCIGPRVSIVCGRHPIDTFVSVHPVFYSIDSVLSGTYVKEQLFEEYQYAGNGKAVIIGNDVWIGADVKILEGVTIGDGAVIAAGSVVKNNVEPYSVVAGIPAKKIKSRFEDEIVQHLCEFQWWNKSEEWIRDNVKSFADVNVFVSEIVKKESLEKC